ncbi:MAG: low molecular weight protein-tyrosine-phosphatase [Gammaproteobacteria bacterium]
MEKLKVLFVCLGNICRSPMAEGVLRTWLESAGLADRVDTDSAGLHDQFRGQPPDARAQRAVQKHDIDISRHRARQIRSQDFATCDYVVAVDRETQAQLHAQCPANLHDKIGLLLDFARDSRECDVPDPYYGVQRNFDAALELIEQGTRGLLRHIQEHHFWAEKPNRSLPPDRGNR